MSLLEALIVLAIVGLIGTIAYPRLEQASQAMVLRQTANLLVQDLRRARAMAIRSGTAASLRPAAGGRAYILPNETRRDLPDGVSLRMAAGEAVRFFPDGTASGGQFVVAGSGRLMGVAVESATGAVATATP